MGETRVFYFGCCSESGHYLWRPGPRPYLCDGATLRHGQPWGARIDASLCVRGVQVEGLALIHHKDGWTALAFWDRSVDTRPGSNSVFLADGTHTFDQMVAIAKEHFPTVWQRFKFDVRLAEPAT